MTSFVVRNMTNTKIEANFERGSDPGVEQGQLVTVTPDPASWKAKVSNIGTDKIELIPEPVDTTAGKFVGTIEVV